MLRAGRDHRGALMCAGTKRNGTSTHLNEGERVDSSLHINFISFMWGNPLESKHESSVHLAYFKTYLDADIKTYS